MAFELNATNDFATLIDRTEDVVLTRAADLATVPLSSALRVAMTQQESDASGGKYTRDDVRWSLVAEQLTEPPRLGDMITDAESRKWTVLEVTFVPAVGRYDCICRIVAITAGLDEQIEIQLATWTTGDAGAPVAIWNTVETNVPARIQPLKREVIVEHQHRLSRTTHAVFVADPLDWTENHRIVDSAGVVYDIASLERAERIDELAKVTVIESPWPLT